MSNLRPHLTQLDIGVIRPTPKKRISTNYFQWIRGTSEGLEPFSLGRPKGHPYINNHYCLQDQNLLIIAKIHMIVMVIVNVLDQATVMIVFV